MLIKLPNYRMYHLIVRLTYKLAEGELHLYRIRQKLFVRSIYCYKHATTIPLMCYWHDYVDILVPRQALPTGPRSVGSSGQCYRSLCVLEKRTSR